eukprot:5025891-Pleurochrysis_carterae.AAC.4
MESSALPSRPTRCRFSIERRSTYHEHVEATRSHVAAARTRALPREARELLCRRASAKAEEDCAVVRA